MKSSRARNHRKKTSRSYKQTERDKKRETRRSQDVKSKRSKSDVEVRRGSRSWGWAGQKRTSSRLERCAGHVDPPSSGCLRPDGAEITQPRRGHDSLIAAKHAGKPSERCGLTGELRVVSSGAGRYWAFVSLFHPRSRPALTARALSKQANLYY
ncbi:predicted protein [Histoplasma capsulatum var. duboisii H88]|uniref:Predicted protein n=2 Tax=Ajellomyces capsulatus TaxID=5037 RepID=F0UR33_AJEC8|nr:predicted protein [Histoplasma capsulatum H143]EGC48360.1 predicted protein [Histoplasma capsulatum var. duboisii H88]